MEISSRNIEQLTEFTWAIRQALDRNGIRGAEGQEIDHVELYGHSEKPTVDSKNFVLCPGKAYDRSPCGTGTSAKLACLFEDGKIKEGQIWRQESIVGSIFEGSVTCSRRQGLPEHQRFGLCKLGCRTYPRSARSILYGNQPWLRKSGAVVYYA